MRDGCETDKHRRREGKRKSDHYIPDHNFSFQLHALLIFQAGKVMSGKVTHFFRQKRIREGLKIKHWMR